MTTATNTKNTSCCVILFSLISLISSSSSFSFTSHPTTNHQYWNTIPSVSSVRDTRLFGGGKGFGKSSSSGKGFGKPSIRSDQTYGRGVIKDVIDTEAAMSEFFTSNAEWAPLFKSFVSNANAPAMSFLDASTGTKNDIVFHEDTEPWKRLSPIPTDDDAKSILASFLDSCHKSLVDIPVDEAVKEDDNDLHFIEEGRRMLALSRFHVLANVHGGTVENYDILFATCWSELLELKTKNEDNTGSLIVLPDYNISDLRRFTDINLLRPLEWLGVESDFEVTSMERGSPAIRLLHKLQDIPDIVPEEPYRSEENGNID